MGKTKRVRTKYHLSSVKSDSFFNVKNDSSEYECLKNDSVKINTENDTSDIVGDSEKNDRSMDTEEATNLKNDTDEKWKGVPDNLFKNIDINMNKLETSLETEEYTETNIMSLSKCIKRSLAECGNNIQLKKLEKRKLRRELFIKAIDKIHQFEKNYDKKRLKKSNVIGRSSEENPKNAMLIKHKSSELLKPTNKLSDLKSPKISKRKQKDMGKVNRKAEDMLKNLEFYNQIISDTKYRSDAMGVITDAVQKHVYSDL